MNALGLVFCILAILSFGAAVSFEKQAGAHRLRSSCLGHIAANRQILDGLASQFYASLKQKRSEKKEKEEKENVQNNEIPPPPAVNPHCARLNLFPLIERGSQEEPFLYETAARLLGIFYKEALFDKKTRAEYKFLDAFLKEAGKQVMDGKFSVLEKISFKDASLQRIYYKMLKGTKKGYPTLLDYVSVEPGASKICLFHAHPNLLSVFFTPKGAEKLYAAMHAPKASAMTQETIERICQEVHAPILDPKVFDLFEISERRHLSSAADAVVGVDPETGISLRKVILLPRLEK